MPEFIHSFQRGRMNKDLDERLIPNGEYRDALNLDIANSEGSNVGTLQNVKGNVELRDKTSTDLWQNNYIEDLSNPVCIGSIRHDIKETIYWFIASDNASVIAEYDQTSGLIKPVLVDKNGILNFSEQYLITGINILDKFLFWTDDQTEPKKINIEKFKRGSVDFDTHTKIPIWTPFNNDETVPGYVQVTLPTTQPDFTEEDITVIKKSPLTAPTLNIAASPFGNNVAGTGILPITFVAEDPAGTGTENFTFIPDVAGFPSAYESLPTYGQFLENTTGPNGSPTYYQDSNLPSNWDGRVTFTLENIYGNDPDTGDPAWNIDDIILIQGSFVNDFNETFEYQIRIKIKQLNNAVITGEIQAISKDIQKFADGDGNTVLIQWEAILEEKAPMFEYVFPRFAYRWKYIDNEYSAFSPFSEVAFVGDEFKYVSSDGYNIGMKNNIRKLIIENLQWGTEEVDEIEILYKESHNTAVYSVDTINKKDFSPYSGTETLPTIFEIKSEIIGTLIQSNQLLRPWDNVPRMAKAQEIVANRIVYGNYLQNYSVDSLIDLSVSVTSKEHQSLNPELTDEQRAANLRMPESSLKSIRTYQAGVVFKDEFGRETPVFTNKKASINLEVQNAHKVNNLQIEPITDAPSWATHYKFFIKETSNEYYNLALDRFYLAEDGNVWLSFPSSERNKVDEETYLILKKQHDNDTFIDNLVRYKILSIKNEAPTFVKTFDTVELSTNVSIIDGFFPDSIFLQFSTGNPTMQDSLSSENYVRISSGGNRTDLYKIAGGGLVSAGSNNFDIQLDEPIGADGAFLTGLTGAVIEIIAKKEENKPEFEGRFFAKINRDFAFDTNIISTFGAIEPRYGIRERVIPKNRIASSNTVNNGDRFGLYYQDPGEDQGSLSLGGSNPEDWYLKGTGLWGGSAFGGVWAKYQPPTRDSRWFGISRVGCNQGDFIGEGFGRANDSVDGLLTAGAFVRFENKATGEYGEVYRIVEIYKRFFHGRGKRKLNGDQTDDAGNRRASIVMRVDRDITDPWLPTQGDTSTLDSVLPTIQILNEVISDNNKLLTSSNPAIFETEPKEAVNLDIYYEASDAIPISDYNNAYELSYYNCYSYGNGVESNRIRDDYNANTIDKGPKVSAPLDEPYSQERRGSGMIFSQIYNSTSGINRLNQFIQAEPITKDLNPIYGTIQKLHTRDTDAIVLCEDKCLRILANKDALYNADGNVNLTGNNAVLGQAVPYAGEFGISKNPESFASYAFRAYFSDKNRGAVIRLSADGITNIAGKGMSDFFADNLRSSTKILGSYDDDKDLYNITLDNLSQQWVNEFSSSQNYQLNPDCNVDQSGRAQTTVSFKESVDGWTGRKSFIPESGVSLNNIYYTFKEGRIYQHNLNTLSNNFYRVQYDSSFNVFINEMPQVVKGFSAINYTGTQSRRFEYLHNAEWYSIAEINFNTTIPTAVQQKQPGWYVNYVKTDLEGGEVKEFEKKEGKWFNYIKALEIFNDCEEIPDGIGNPDVIDSEPQDYILTVTIDEDCSGSGGITPDTIQAFVNIWGNIKNDPIYDLNIVNETTAQDVKCAIEELYDLFNQSYGNVTNEATAFSYVLADGLQVGTQMYDSLTNEPITSAGAYLFVGTGEQMSDLTVSHAGLDANNPTVVPSTYYVMILDSNGQIASWTQYNTLAACEDDCMPDTEINFYWFRSPDSSDIYSGVNWSGYTNFGNARYAIEENFTDYPNGGPVGNVNVEWRYNLSDGVTAGTKIWNYGQHVNNPCEFIPFNAMYLWIGSSTVDPNLALDPNDPTPIPNEYKLIKITDGIITQIVQYNSVTPTP
jgi:hypothetical protein